MLSSNTPQRTEVTVIWHDYYSEILGPPGARGLPESGRICEPVDAQPAVSADLFDGFGMESRKLGLSVRESKQEGERPKVDRYDFGSVTEVSRLLTAAGAGSAILALLRGARPLIAQWLKNRAGRTVTVKSNDFEITVKGDADIAKAIQALERLQKVKQ